MDCRITVRLTLNCVAMAVSDGKRVPGAKSRMLLSNSSATREARFPVTILSLPPGSMDTGAKSIAINIFFFSVDVTQVYILSAHFFNQFDSAFQ